MDHNQTVTTDRVVECDQVSILLTTSSRSDMRQARLHFSFDINLTHCSSFEERKRRELQKLSIFCCQVWPLPGPSSRWFVCRYLLLMDCYFPIKFIVLSIFARYT